MDTNNLNSLIQQGESDTLEFKKTTSEWRGIVETVSAFANSGGGTIVIGVKDSGDIIGQTVSDDTLKNLVNGIALNIEPKIYPVVQKIQYEEKSLICIEMEESPLKPHIAFGRYFLRVGPAN